VRRHFSNNLDRNEKKLIGLYDEGIVWSIPDFGITMTIDFFRFFVGSTHVL